MWKKIKIDTYCFFGWKLTIFFETINSEQELDLFFNNNLRSLFFVVYYSNVEEVLRNNNIEYRNLLVEKTKTREEYEVCETKVDNNVLREIFKQNDYSNLNLNKHLLEKLNKVDNDSDYYYLLFREVVEREDKFEEEFFCLLNRKKIDNELDNHFKYKFLFYLNEWRWNYPNHEEFGNFKILEIKKDCNIKVLEDKKEILLKYGTISTFYYLTQLFNLDRINSIEDSFKYIRDMKIKTGVISPNE